MVVLNFLVKYHAAGSFARRVEKVVYGLSDFKSQMNTHALQ